MQGSIPTVLEKLLNEQRLLCPKDATPLIVTDEGLRSRSATWMVKNRSLDLYGQYDGSPSQFEDYAFANEVAKALGFAESELSAVTAAVADTALVAGESAYTAEIFELADRLGISREMAAKPHPADAENSDAVLTIVSAHVPAFMKAGVPVTRSVRIRNGGASYITSSGPNPVYLSYHWLDTSGVVIEFEGMRSPLPIDLAPGACVTVVCDVAPPADFGNYNLQFQAVVENVRWINEATLTVPVSIVEELDIPAEFAYTSDAYSYGEDHAIGLHMAYVALQAKKGISRVLEVGGGIHPQSNSLAGDNCEVVSIDISSPMSQLGQLYFDHIARNDRIAFVTCDAHTPPFSPGTFDGVMIFSALHHFADPVRLLSNLRKVVSDDGFIATMCEPCVPNRYDPQYLRDLEKGINEQLWTVEEYVEIFHRAGLKVQSGRVDGGSLKAILTVV